MIQKVFKLIDFKINKITEDGKRASLIIINEGLFKRLQQDVVQESMEQKYGTLKSPHTSLTVYQNCKIMTSQVVETVEVF